MLTRALAEPNALVIGIDANAAAMAKASRRAARPATRGGLANALFVVAAAERPPAELVGTADELTIILPWGSLLLGTLALDGTVASGIVSLLRPDGCITAFVSVTARDGLALGPSDEPVAAGALAKRWASHGLRLEGVRPATVAELRATGSTWARRLGAGRERPVWRLTLRRDGARTGSPAQLVDGLSTAG